MDLNIKHFIAILFLLTIAAIFSLKPHRIEVVDKKGIPQVQFIDFKSYEITPEGVEAWVKGESGKKFGEMMHIVQLMMKRRTEAGVEFAMAKEALLNNRHSIDLYENVRLERDDGWRFETSRLHYDMSKKIYSTQGASFVAFYGKNVVQGKNLRYLAKSGKITAEKIRARIYETGVGH